MYIDSQSIAKELGALRNKKGVSLEQASKDLDIHSNTLSKYEKDASDMKLSTFEKMLNYYNVDELIFFKVIREYNHD